MEDTLQINLNRGTNFEFELSISGISGDSAKVSFGIESTNFTVCFPCTRGDDGNWSVSIPSLEKFLDEGNYTYTITLVVDGYHFAPVTGTAHVAPVAEVKGSTPHSKVEVSFGGLKATDDKTGDEVEVEAKTEKAEEKAVEKAEKKVTKKKPAKKKVKEAKKPAKPLDKNKSILSQLNEKSDEAIEADKAAEKDGAVKKLIEDL